MYLESPQLRKSDEAFRGVDHQVLGGSAVVLGQLHPLYPGRYGTVEMLLEKTLLIVAFRAAHERQGPAGEVRQHQRGRGLVIVHKVFFRVAVFRIKDPVRVGHSRFFGGAPLRRPLI